MSFKSWLKTGVVLILGVAIGVGVVLGWLHFKSSSSPIPKNIKKQLSFIVLYPAPDPNTKVNKATFKYDSQNGVFSFVVLTYGISNTITEQSTPDPFNDIPNYYQTFVTKLRSYSTFDTDIGKVDLTRPDSLNGGQAAVMNSKGVLLFAHPTKDLTKEQWQHFFNSLETIK